MRAQGWPVVVVIWWPIIFVSTLSCNLLTFGILTGKTHMFYSISLFRSFFVLLIFLKKCCNLQQIHTFGASRAGETLTCKTTPLFTMCQAPFFQGGGPGEA